MTLLLIMLWPLAIVSGAATIYWLLVLWRVKSMLRDQPTVRAGLSLAPPPQGWPRVSIIVPAHNEERIIDQCAARLAAQNYENLEIIFVLDRCTDRTLEIVSRHAAQDNRISIIENDSCPEGWSGKCNAVRIGADRATGDWLLFADADTLFDPALTRASVAIALKEQCALLTLYCNLTFDRLFERIAQPVATMLLARMFPIRRVTSDKRPRPAAAGSFMLFSREWYERIGGHEAVRDSIGEDIELARRVWREGGDIAVRIADGMLVVRMYGTLAALRAGWKRVLIEACGRRVRRLRKYAARLLVSGILVPAIHVGLLTLGAILMLTEAPSPSPLGAFALIAGALGLIVQFSVLAWIYSLGGAPKHAAIYYPAGCWIMAGVMFAGAGDLVRRVPQRWAGKEYIIEPR